MKNFKDEFVKKVVGVTCEAEESVSKKYDDMVEHLNGISKDDETILHNLGIETKGKDLCTVMNSLKNKWNRFSNIERCAAVTAIAGVRAISDINAYVDSLELTTNAGIDK